MCYAMGVCSTDQEVEVTTAAATAIGTLTVTSWDAQAFDTVEAARGKTDAIVEPKLDGIRLLCQVTADGSVRLWTRNGNDKAKYAVKIAEEIGAKFPAGTWIDAEAVTMTVDAEGRVVNDWGGAQSILGGNPKPLKAQERLSLVVFDLMAHGGIDARPAPFAARRGLLEKIFDAHDWERLSLVFQMPAVEESHEILLAQGFEGSMVKSLRAPYGSGRRGKGLGKIKARWTLDAIVMGAKPGEGSFAGLVGAIIFGQYDESGELVERGKCSGMDFKTRVWMTEHLDELVAKQQVIEVAHNGVLPGCDGLRHPQFKRLRDDKDAASVTLHDK